jgi:hypothetical protein
MGFLKFPKGLSLFQSSKENINQDYFLPYLSLCGNDDNNNWILLGWKAKDKTETPPLHTIIGATVHYTQTQVQSLLFHVCVARLPAWGSWMLRHQLQGRDPAQEQGTPSQRERQAVMTTKQRGKTHGDSVST